MKSRIVLKRQFGSRDTKFTSVRIVYPLRDINLSGFRRAHADSEQSLRKGTVSYIFSANFDFLYVDL